MNRPLGWVPALPILVAAGCASLPKVTALSALESPGFLGCQAGFTYVYVNTAGEVFPCTFAPLSFGNVYRTGCEEILGRLAKHIPSASKTCLLARLPALNDPSTDTFPTPWSRTQEILEYCEPDEPPAFIKTLTGRRDGKS